MEAKAACVRPVELPLGPTRRLPAGFLPATG
jgi:hypothetical protein